MTFPPPAVPSAEDTAAGREIAREQGYVDLLYREVGERRAAVTAQLARVLGERAAAGQAQVERDVAVRRLQTLAERYTAVEHGLCFGRVDTTAGDRHYLGRVGLLADDQEAEPLLVDWRAPAARPFYTATAAAPQGLSVRRHLHTRGRTVLRLDDELLDGTGTPPADTELTGEAALLTALDARRTGRMRDIVATLQAEQDRIIRSPLPGCLVVQGGPGTGKTVVALHRAAYLLYTHPRLEDRGVLVVGPNPVFLSYIGQVLPGLGETSVLLATAGELLPGVTADRPETPAAAEVKGRLAMAGVLEAAVRRRQGAGHDVTVALDGEHLTLTRDFLAAAAAAARAGRRPHNLARPAFHDAVLDELARQLAGVVHALEDAIDADLAGLLDPDDLDRAAGADLAGVFGDDAPVRDAQAVRRAEAAEFFADWRERLPGDPAVTRLLERLWPALTPQGLLGALFADPAELAAAAPGLTPADRAALRRAPGGWSEADVPLLDEAAELLGHDDRADRAAERAERAREIAYAQGVLDIARGSRAQEADDPDAAEELSAADVVDAGRLASRHTEADRRTVAERAAADRTWVFGHVVVDEAQELSAMAWRMLLRRCPTRSFTIVGDTAQTGGPAGATSWDDALTPFFADRRRHERLTVNYRTPAAVVEAAQPVLDAIRPGEPPTRAVRAGDHRPWREATTARELPALLARRAAEETAAAGAGRVAVIVPAQALAAWAPRLPGASWGADPDLARPLVVLTPAQSKGLEFDTVLVADPAAMTRRDLYVALTRTCRRLGVVHPGEVPPLLAHLPER